MTSMKITTPAIMCIHNRTSLQSFTIVLQTNGKPDRKPIPCNSASRKEGCVNVNGHFVDIYAENYAYFLLRNTAIISENKGLCNLLYRIDRLGYF